MKNVIGIAASIATLGCAALGHVAAQGTPAPYMAVQPAVAAPDAATLARMIRNGEITAEASLEAYLRRIDAYDQVGPKIQSIISLNPNALAEARVMDAEAAQGRFRGPLHGVPVLIKDNIETREMVTTAGSLALIENMTERDAPIVERLRKDGAIILGKTNLSEWANFRSEDSISGWSAVGGQTRNPHSLDRTPCGSSSGSAAAVAANFAPLALGTETNGSITCPAAMNGVYGFKPTVGLLSRTHIVPISPSQDTAGPMGRSVEDLALALNSMAGSEGLDKSTRKADLMKTDYVGSLNRGVSGVRVGVLKFAEGNSPSVRAQMRDTVEVLETLGATVVEIREYSVPDGMWDDAYLVLKAEFGSALNAYLASTPEIVRVRTLSELIEFNRVNAFREQALFGQDILQASLASKGTDDPAYAAALARIQNAAKTNGIDGLLEQYQVDVLIAPSRPPAFLVDVVYGDRYPDTGIGADWMAAIAGYPNMTIPMGVDSSGLPLGLSVMSGAWQEPLILRVGHALTVRQPKMRPPSFASGPHQHPSYMDKVGPWRNSGTKGQLIMPEIVEEE